MTLSKPDMYDTSVCRLAMPISVRHPISPASQISNVFFLGVVLISTLTVHAMQSEEFGLILSFPDHLTRRPIDYAINNKLTPFISMQNHYNLVYREEEREVFPTLKVRRRTRTFSGSTLP
jgi:hypothetical protein